MTSETPLSRRRLLQSTAALGTLAVAGCSGGGSSTPTNPPLDPTNSTATGTDGAPGTETPSETETETGYDTVDEAEPTAIMGEVVADEKFALVVREMQRGVNQDDGESSDTELVLLEVAIRNRTTGEYMSFDNIRMYLADGEGERHPRRLLASDAGAELVNEQLAPGELAWSRVLFQVSGSPDELDAVFTIDTPAISFDRITVELGETADTVATLDQSLDVVTHSVGQTVTDNDISVTLDDVRIEEEIEGVGGAGEERVFVIPTISVENGTEEPQIIRPYTFTSIKDGNGRAYPISEPGRQALENGIDRQKQIAIGNTYTGEIPYAVPTATQALYFVFDFSVDLDGFRRFWEL